MKQHLIVEVFRSSKNEGMYLYVEKSIGLKDIPDELMALFGKGISAMTMLLKPDSKLARANAESVIADIKEKGYYLQLPPVKEESLLDAYMTPTKAAY